ncbi:MAG: YggS family pyridoxal phosphate-dependent enzyme [Candidatus Diapherotrites archaeon]|uniref:Pyridoxal phosphate homeostasis protein n=1 Tax=Candidatus Iainarchaeum sp. TaxID=3101447 RepID=A0A2D6LPP2_9ARCH|nr:YggS family pyridoxal phosphate-dependent enzyme [Candidatus Diapherotrites archaeon]|tara:strand:- start:11499 stop:12161 length:663 start_codon:yes stop_codon:yes gene_type:complete
MSVKENYSNLQKEIKEACEKVRRKPEEITLVGVTKNQEIPKIKELVEAGIRDIGESKAQELEEKYPDLKEMKADIHFIGHLQSNKVKKVVEMSDYIHSVDSLDLLRKIHYAASDMNKVQSVFLQVNTSGEKQKFGMPPKEVESMMSTMKNLPYDNVEFIGLMTMAQHTEDEEIIRDSFRTLYDLKEHLNITHLSMGMSNDYKIAIEEGSTVLRIGRKLFE